MNKPLYSTVFAQLEHRFKLTSSPAAPACVAIVFHHGIKGRNAPCVVTVSLKPANAAGPATNYHRGCDQLDYQALTGDLPHEHALFDRRTDPFARPAK